MSCVTVGEKYFIPEIFSIHCGSPQNVCEIQVMPSSCHFFRLTALAMLPSSTLILYILGMYMIFINEQGVESSCLKYIQIIVIVQDQKWIQMGQNLESPLK